MPQDLVKIRRALLSVSDKAGIVDFAKALLTHGVEILSTGGTAKLLQLNGVVVTEVGAYTGFPEMMDGRVKTLHPKVHGGILARRDLKDHVAAMEKHGIARIEPMGQKFDPNLHQAMFEVPDPSVPAGTVVQVVQPGYTIGGRVLRPAMVAIAKGGPKAGEAPANDNAGAASGK